MVKQVWAGVVRDYPEFAELNSLLTLAATTWPRWGISAAQLAQMDEEGLTMLRLIVEG